MSEDGHRYTFAGFGDAESPYWRRKEELQRAETLAKLAADHDDDDENYYCEQCNDWHGPDWD